MKNIMNLRNVAILIACLAASSAFAQSRTITGNDTYEINLSALPLNGGLVSGGGSYAFGEEAIVTAVSDSCYKFISWTENDVVVSYDPVYPFIVTQPRDLIAHFEIKYYDVFLLPMPTAGGAIFGSGTFICGESAVVCAFPDACYDFVGWTSGDVWISTNNCFLFTVTGDITLVANFKLKTSEVTVVANPPDGGEVFGGGIFPCWDMVAVWAEPNDCYDFVNWTENDVVVSEYNPFVFYPTEEDRVLVANFELKTCEITAVTNPPQSGYVLVEPSIYQNIFPNGMDIPCEENITVEAIPLPCYNFVNWTVNGVVVSVSSSYTFSVMGDIVLVANFELITYEITVLANPPEGGTVTGGGVYISCESVAVCATPNPCYNFIGWTDGETGELIFNLECYIFSAIKSLVLVANFEKTYGITLLSNPPEAGEVIGSGLYNYGDVVTVSGVPNHDYDFVNWLEDGIEIATGSDYTFTVTGTRTLTGNFETYDVVILSNPPGCGVSGGGNYRPGIEVTVSANTRSGNYEFVNWTRNGAEVSTNPEYTFITAIEDMELVANFVETSVGIETIGIDGIRIYPNPTDGELRVEMCDMRYEICDITIFDTFGRKLQVSNLKSQISNHQIDISHLPNGVYFLRIQTENGVVVRKVVKQ